jgi:hypothetical protein
MFLLMACGGASEPTRLQSSAAEGEKSAPVILDLGAVHRPDGKTVLTGSQLGADSLAAFLPEIEDLEDAELAVLLDAVNLTTAACEPCLNEGVSLGSCALRSHPSCSNLPTLIQRAFRIAIQGGDLAEAQAAIGFVEPWQELPRLGGDLKAEVLVTFAVDYLDPFSHRAWAPWVTLQKEYGDALQFQLLHVPHSRHAGAGDFAELVFQAGMAGKALGMHEAIIAGGEQPDLAVLSAHSLLEAVALEKAEITKGLSEHKALAARLGVDSTPVVWINGYRLSGQRDIGILQRFVDLALADRPNEER